MLKPSNDKPGELRYHRFWLAGYVLLFTVGTITVFHGAYVRGFGILLLGLAGLQVKPWNHFPPRR
jgi:hypothetical protein